MAKRTKNGNKPKRGLKVVASPLLGSDEFRPTALQIQFAQIYLRRLADDEMNEENSRGFEISILENDLHKNGQNWYNWKVNAGFMKWFLSLREGFHGTIGLANVHNSIYKHALKDSPADRKLMLERFDRNYKPQTSQSISFVGSRPADNVNEDDMREQSEQFRKRIESKVSDISIAI
jgi:hypothetical protein